MPTNLIVRQYAHLKVMFWYFRHGMSERPSTQHKHTTNITTMVMELLAPPARWILRIHAARVAGGIAHILPEAANKGC
jgi:hypothetical protein